MEKKILRRFIILLSSVVLLATVSISVACSWWDPDEELQAVVLIAPESTKLPEFSLFYLSNNRYYGYAEYDAAPEGLDDPYHKINTEEWYVYFGKKASTAEVEEFVYSSSEERFKAYRAKIDSKATDEGGAFPMLKAGAKKLSPALTYLEIAYRVNVFCTPTYDEWGEYTGDEVDPAEQLALTDELKKIYSSTKEPFLKQRYVFLLQRVYQTGGLYSSSISLFDTEAVKYDTKSSIYVRSLGYKAAALYKQKQYSEANFLYAIIFDRMPDGRTSALWSFHPVEEEDWNKTLAMAKTPQEKCAVWLMFGLTANAIKALQEIYEINPGYIPARLLASRAVNQAEANSSEDTHYYYGEKSDNNELAAILSAYAGNKLSTDPAFWNLMSAYMYYHTGDTDNASKWLASGKKLLSKEDTLLQDHYTLTEMLVRVKQSSSVNDKLQKDLAVFLKFEWCADQKFMRTDAIYGHFMRELDRIYSSENNEIMVALCRNRSASHYKDNMPFIQKMLKFMQQENHNELETLLLSKYFLNENDLIEEIGLVHLYNYHLDKSFGELSKIPTGTLPGNPFNIRINDCHDCDHEMAQKVTYSKSDLVKKLIDMELVAQRDPKANAQTYFLLANAYYNITYFGNNRAMYETTLYSNDFDYYYYGFMSYENDEEEREPLKDVFNCAKAEAYYLLAYKYAPNNEFAAKCLFMAAKCEQNAFFMTEDHEEGTVDFRSGKHFRALRDRYYDTKYFKEIIHECGYFEEFMRQNPR